MPEMILETALATEPLTVSLKSDVMQSAPHLLVLSSMAVRCDEIVSLLYFVPH